MGMGCTSRRANQWRVGIGTDWQTHLQRQMAYTRTREVGRFRANGTEKQKLSRGLLQFWSSLAVTGLER